MNHRPAIGPSLSDVCPEFKAKIAEYMRAAKNNPEKAARKFREMEEIARQFRNRERAQ